MARSACGAIVVACALFGCAREGRVDLEAAFGHAVRVLETASDGSGGFVIAGRIKEDAPPGLAGVLPWEGRWLPFVARCDERGRVEWIRELSAARSVPHLWLGAHGGLWMETIEGNTRFVEPVFAYTATRRICRQGCDD